MSTTTTDAKAPETKTATKTIKLPTGSTAVIQPGKGKHAMQASRIADGDQTKFMPALMSLLVTIDDKPLVMEEVEEMDLADYLTIMAEFGANFI